MVTPSCSDVEESAQEQSRPQSLTQHSACERERVRPFSETSPAKRSDLPPPAKRSNLPPPSLSPSLSETCSDEDTPTGSELEEVPLLVSAENQGRREEAEKGGLLSVPRASTMRELGAVGHPTSIDPLVHPHSLFGAKGNQTKQDRLRALSISALTLKAKVEMERKRILEATQMGIVPDWRAQGSPIHVSTRGGTSPVGVSPSSSPRRSIGINTEQQPTEYPGVGNLDTHVLAMHRERKERTAATNIQAAFRGYVVRKALKGTGRWPNSGAQHMEVGGTKLNIGAHEGRLVGSSETFATSGAPHKLGSATTPPTAPPTSMGTGDEEGLQPWEQRGGDVHSLVHVIAKQEARRRRKAAERTSSVPQVGAAEDVGVQVDVAELSRAEGDWNGTRGEDCSAAREDGMAPVQEVSGGAVGAHTEPHTSPSIPLQGEAVSPARQTSSTATPPAEQVSPTATPPAERVSPTATPPAEQVSPTATPPAPLVSMEPDSLAEDSTLDTNTLEVSQMHGVQGRAGLAVTDPPEGDGTEEAGRLSPRSLQLKLSAELMLLETAQDQMQHLGEVERARHIALAQRETLSVAQVLKVS